MDWEILLDRTSGDWDAREMYTVWLQDEADDLEGAAFQRWLIREKKFPDNINAAGGSFLFSPAKSWDWWEGNDNFIPPDPNIPETSILSSLIFKYLPPLQLRTGSYLYGWREYHTRQEAEDVLRNVLVELNLLEVASPT